MKKLIIAASVSGCLFLAACGNGNSTDADDDSLMETPGMNDPANSTYDPRTMDSTNQMTTDSSMMDSTMRRDSM